jgi:hypothetical protein
MQKFKNIFPGYIILIVGGIVSYWGGGIYVYAAGNYLTALTEAFRWSRAEISLTSSFNGIATGIQGAFT